MPENNLNIELSRLDSLDDKKDKKISVVEGKEEELTDTFIKRSEDLLDKVAELEDEDPMKNNIKADVVNYLKGIDGSNIEQSEKEFRAKVDSFITKVELRIEIQHKIETLESISSWGELAGMNTILNCYKKNLLNGKEISENSVLILEDYVNQSVEKAKRYMPAVAYFMDDKMPMPENNAVMAKFITTQVIEKILTGEMNDTAGFLKEFEEITKEAEEKRKECESFVNGFKEKVLQSKVGGQVLKLVDDRNEMINMFSALIETSGLSQATVLTKIEKVLKLRELNDISDGGSETPNLRQFLHEGWQTTSEARIFLISAVLRGESDVEFKKMRAELFTEKIFKDIEIKTTENIKKQMDAMDSIVKDMSKFKEKYTVNGKFYSNLSIDGDSNESITFRDSVGDKIKIKKGDFKEFYNMEKQLELGNEKVIKLQIDALKNASLYILALTEIEKSGQYSLEKIESIVSDISRREAPITPQIISMEADLSLVEFRNREKKDLTKELSYRQSLELLDSVGEIKNPETRAYVASKNDNEAEHISIINKRLIDQTESFSVEIEALIQKYGSIDNVPQEEKESVKYKLNSWLELFGKSMEFLVKERANRLEVLLLQPERASDPRVNELESIFSRQKTIVARIHEFAKATSKNYEIDDMPMAEVDTLIAGQLNSKIKAKTDIAIEGLIKTSNDVNWYLNGQMQMDIEKRQRLSQSLYSPFHEALKKTLEMKKAILYGRTLLGRAKDELMAEKEVITGIFAQQPGLVKARNKFIDNAITGINNLLNTEFSDKKLLDIERAEEQIQEGINSMNWNMVATGVVIVLSVASAMVGGVVGGLVGKGLSVLFQLGTGSLAATAVGVATSSVFIAAATTFSSRGAQELAGLLPGQTSNVDWSPEALLKDFGTYVLYSLVISGAAMTTGKIMMAQSARAAQRCGLSLEEYMSASPSKLLMVKKFLNPLNGSSGEKNVTEGVLGTARTMGGNFIEEVFEEGILEPAAGRIAGPAGEGLVSLINSLDGSHTNSPRANTDINIDGITISFDQATNQFDEAGTRYRSFVEQHSPPRSAEPLDEFDLLPDRDEEIQAQESSSQSLPLETRHNGFRIPILEGEERFFRHAETRDDEMSIPYSKIEAMAAVIKKFNKMSKTELEESSSEELFVKLTDGIELTPNQKELVKKRVLQMKQNVETAKQAIESPEVFANMIFRSEVGASGDLSVKLDHPVEVRIGERKLPSHIVLILEETDFLRLDEGIKEPWGSLDQDRQEVLKQTKSGGIALDLPGFNGNITVITRKTKMGHNGPYEGVIDHEEIHHINKIFGIRNESLVNRKAKDQYLATGDYDKYLEGAFAEQMAWSKDEILAFYRQGYPASSIIETLELSHEYSGVLTDAFSRIHEDYKSERITRTRFEDLKKQIDIYEKAYKARLRQLIDAAEDIMFESNNGYEILMATPMEWWGGVRNRLLNNTESVFESNSSTDEMDVE